MKQTLLAWCKAGPCTVPSISYILFRSSQSHTQHFSLLGYSLFWKLALHLIASWSPLAGMFFLMVFTFWNLLAIFRTWLKMASSVPSLSCPHGMIFHHSCFELAWQVSCSSLIVHIIIHGGSPLWWASSGWHEVSPGTQNSLWILARAAWALSHSVMSDSLWPHGL